MQDSDEWVTNLVNLARESMDLGEGESAPYFYLFTLLERFQQRDLRDENDAINAMSGLLRRVAQATGTSIVEGLPAKIFPLATIFLHLRELTPQRR